jgi:hypothetical protein
MNKCSYDFIKNGILCVRTSDAALVSINHIGLKSGTLWFRIPKKILQKVVHFTLE